MVHAYHLVFGTYGFWLPNDPRGSWSNYVGARRIYELGGKATKTVERRSLARVPHDGAVRRATKRALKYPPVEFVGIQARAVMRGFGRYVTNNGLTCWAAAVMPDHVHLVMVRHWYSIEKVAEQLKKFGTDRLNEEQLHPFREFPKEKNRYHTCWARKAWAVYLDSEEAIRRAIRYVEQNPVRDGKRPQSWPFVTPFEHV